MRIYTLLGILFLTCFQAKELLAQSPSLKVGTYNVGSRYITIARKGSRTCYQGISMPSGRYAVAVGETTGSLSYKNGEFLINGWQQYGKSVTLRQQDKNLLVTHDNGWTGEYTFFKNGPLGSNFSESLNRCLSKTTVFFETAPDYKIKTQKSRNNNFAAKVPKSKKLIRLGKSKYSLYDKPSYLDSHSIKKIDAKSYIYTTITDPERVYGNENDILVNCNSPQFYKIIRARYFENKTLVKTELINYRQDARLPYNALFKTANSIVCRSQQKPNKKPDIPTKWTAPNKPSKPSYPPEGIKQSASLLNITNIENVIKSQFTEQAGISISSVDCPKRVTMRMNNQFNCRVTDTNSKTIAALVTQTDDQGAFSWNTTRGLISFDKVESLIKTGIKSQENLLVIPQCGNEIVRYTIAYSGDTFKCVAKDINGRVIPINVLVQSDDGQVNVTWKF